MLKFFLRLIKKVLFNILFLYSYNLIIVPIGVIIPINLITVCALTVFGIPALFSFILISVLLF